MMGYFTLTLNSSNLGGNAYINNISGFSLDVVAALIVTVLLKKFCRRHTLAFLTTCLAIFCLLSPTMKQGNLLSENSTCIILQIRLLCSRKNKL